MTKNEILAQPLYQEAIKLFVSRSLAFNKAAKDYKDNQNPEKELDLEKNSKSAWALYCYQMSYLLYLAERIKDDDVNAANEATKDLKQIVFNDLQGKYEYIMFITKPQNLY